MKLDQLISAFEGQFVWLRARRRPDERFDDFLMRISRPKRFKERIQFYNHWLTDEEWEHSPFLALCLYVGVAKKLGFDQFDVECELQIDELQYDNLLKLYNKYMKKAAMEAAAGIKPKSGSACGKFRLKYSLVKNYLKVNFNIEI